jgi:hypothetical protein
VNVDIYLRLNKLRSELETSTKDTTSVMMNLIDKRIEYKLVEEEIHVLEQNAYKGSWELD